MYNEINRRRYIGGNSTKMVFLFLAIVKDFQYLISMSQFKLFKAIKSVRANLPFPHFSHREKQSILIENITFKQEKRKNYY